MRLTRGDHVVVRLLLLQHQPHGAHVVARVAPVAGGLEIAERQLPGQAELDARHPVGDLAGHELDAAQRALVVEQDAGRGVQPEALAVVHGHAVRVELGRGVRRARIERRALVLHRLLDQPVHLRRRGLVETARRPRDADRLEQVDGTQSGHRAGEQRLLPARRDEGLRRQVVCLVRLHVLHDPDQAREVEQVAVHQLHLLEHAEPAQALVDAVGGGGAPGQADDAIAFLEQQGREIGAVLSGDAGDQGCGHGAWSVLWQGACVSQSE